MYVHDKIISAETYIEFITGKHYDLERPDQFEEMAEIMRETGNDDLWDFPIEDIEEILENDTPVVLVDVYGTTIDDNTMHHVHRWFELPDNNKDEDAIRTGLNKIEKHNSKENNI